MDTEKTEGVADTTKGEGEGAETVSIPKADYDKLNQTLGSLKREIKDLKKSETKKETEEAPQKPQSNEPDYAKLAFLNGKGLDHADDVSLVLKESERLKLPLTDILGMKHIQAQLQDAKDGRASQAALPTGNGKAGGNTQNDVEYCIAKGELPKDQDLAAKVVNAKISAHQKFNQWSDELYTG